MWECVIHNPSKLAFKLYVTCKVTVINGTRSSSPCQDLHTLILTRQTNLKSSHNDLLNSRSSEDTRLELDAAVSTDLEAHAVEPSLWTGSTWAPLPRATAAPSHRAQIFASTPSSHSASANPAATAKQNNMWGPTQPNPIQHKINVPILVGCLKWTSTVKLRMVTKKLKIISYTTLNPNSGPLDVWRSSYPFHMTYLLTLGIPLLYISSKIYKADGSGFHFQILTCEKIIVVNMPSFWIWWFLIPAIWGAFTLTSKILTRTNSMREDD